MKTLVPYLTTSFALIGVGVCFASVGEACLPGRLGTFCGGVLLATSVLAGITDWKWRKILNSTTFSAAFVLLATYLFSWERVLIPVESMLLGAGLCLFLTGVPWFLTGKGAGDVKLAMVFGAFLGPLPGIAAIILVYLSAAGLMISLYFLRHGVLVTVRSVYQSVLAWVFPLWVMPPTPLEKALVKSSMPLGPLFFLSAIFVLSRTWPHLTLG